MKKHFQMNGPHGGIKCSPYDALFGVPMKLGIANCVLPRNLTINMTTEEDLEKVININNECRVI